MGFEAEAEAGIPEKDWEDTREIVTGKLTRVVPLWTDNGATSNNTPRTIITQFEMKTVRDDVWKRSRDVRVCSEMHNIIIIMLSNYGKLSQFWVAMTKLRCNDMMLRVMLFLYLLMLWLQGSESWVVSIYIERESLFIQSSLM